MGFRTKAFLVLLLLAVTLIPAFSQSKWNHGRLKISENRHFLQYEDGTPFFWLGDTGWELFNRLKKEEMEKYMENRRAKGFNLIQAVIIANVEKPLCANQYGQFPVLNENPLQPNEAYFQLVDWTLELALKKNLFMGLLPTWGGTVSKLGSTGKELFNLDNAYAYGLWLGKRYKSYPNIIWIAGGDRPAFTDKDDWRPVWNEMIRGIKEGTENKAIITYHPWGERSSSEFWPNSDTTLGVNMLQSGHKSRDIPVWKWVARDFNLKPAKPIVDGEPTYEDHPINWKVENGYFRDYDVRKQIYRAVFSGASGVTYGHTAVWQFYNPKEENICFADRYWFEALDRPGAFQAGYLKNLIVSRPSLDRVPDQSMIISGQGDSASYITAFRDRAGSYAMVYLPIGKKISLNTSSLKASKLIAWWFDPQTGSAEKIGEFKYNKMLSFTAPANENQKDRVLVLDDASKKWGAPGRGKG